MSSCLIGASGFVGQALLRQRQFDCQVRRTTIDEVDGRSFDLTICAGAPAQKWIANEDPNADRRNIEVLMGHLSRVTCGTLVLISTVDVFREPSGVDEDTEVVEAGLSAYGRHRRELEKFVQTNFARHLIVRLPGLVGPGLRKNVVFDLLNDNNLQLVDSRGVFQFYPMVNLWFDVEAALAAGLKLAHFTSEPVSVADVARSGFNRVFHNVLDKAPVVYDFRTRFASAFGGSGAYQYQRRETLQAIRAYAQSEPRRGEPAAGLAS